MADSRSELSMDEILSSIKKIIADEDRAKPGSAKKAPKTPAISLDESDADDEILELTVAADPAPAAPQAAEFAQHNAGIETPMLTETPRLTESDVLLDDNKARSLRHSFSALQTLAEPGVPPQIVRSGETSLEGLTRDLLRPMLKDWLDSHLPGIVESMVEREIARITKKD
jgi:uncharacterized protein